VDQQISRIFILMEGKSKNETKLKAEGSELSQKLGQLKMQSADGKFYKKSKTTALADGAF
jgi:hypothetical protein